jgi:23S rRNA pseudouridine955/2504/2580 synthase
VTHFRVRETHADTTLIEARPVTGRTHQIRVHAAHSGQPLLGDDKYANDVSRAATAACDLRRLFLHAASLRFRLGDCDYAFEAPLDTELATVLERLRRS